MKKIMALILTVALSCTLFICGCFSLGADGRDGKDLDIYEIYEAVNEERKANGLEELDFLEFVSEYLNYTESQLDEITSIQSTMNRSMQSAVSIISSFSYSERIYGFQTTTTYSVGQGSGVIIDLDKQSGDALIVTNCHVIYDYSSDEKFSEDIRLYLYGQDVYGVNYLITESTNGYRVAYDENYRIPATVVGASITYDIAVLKVEGSEVIKRSDVEKANFCEDEWVTVGETVYAVGNASGAGTAVTEGIISRDSEEIYLNLKDTDKESDYIAYRVLRTDTAINGGNSGGGLYNSKGEVIAIVNAKAVQEDIDNMGYAIPASTAKRVAQSLIDNASASSGIKKAQFGITTEITDSYAEYSDEKGAVELFETVKVSEINSGIVSSKGGLEVGDVFVKISVGSGKDSSFTARDEVEIQRSYNISDILLSVRKGDTLKVTVERNGNLKDFYYEFNSDSYFTNQI